MKTGTPDHPKMLDLADWLDQATGGALAGLMDPQAAAVGLLEGLWHWAAKYAPAGDVGRFSDARIAEAAGWRGDAGALMEALVRIGWLDRSEGHRLVVHDWTAHCEEAVHLRLGRMGRRFCDGTIPRLTKLNQAERARALALFEVAGGDVRTECARNAHGVRTECAQDGHCQGQGQGQEPIQEPETGQGPRAREAARTAGTAPCPETDGARDPEMPPHGVDPEDWSNGCEMADVVEQPVPGVEVVGLGGEARARCFATLLERWVGPGTVGAVEVMQALLQGQREAARGDPGALEIWRGLAAYPRDGAYPMLIDAMGQRRDPKPGEWVPSRVEQLLKRAGTKTPSQRAGRKRTYGTNGFAPIGAGIGAALDGMAKGSQSSRNGRGAHN